MFETFREDFGSNEPVVDTSVWVYKIIKNWIKDCFLINEGIVELNIIILVGKVIIFIINEEKQGSLEMEDFFIYNNEIDEANLVSQNEDDSKDCISEVNFMDA